MCQLESFEWRCLTLHSLYLQCFLRVVQDTLKEFLVIHLSYRDPSQSNLFYLIFMKYLLENYKRISVKRCYTETFVELKSVFQQNLKIPNSETNSRINLIFGKKHARFKTVLLYIIKEIELNKCRLFKEFTVSTVPYRCRFDCISILFYLATQTFCIARDMCLPLLDGIAQNLVKKILLNAAQPEPDRATMKCLQPFIFW